VKFGGLETAALAMREDGIKHETENNNENDNTNDDDHIVKFENPLCDGSNRLREIQPVFGIRHRSRYP
jgi:hypothetical protein